LLNEFEPNAFIFQINSKGINLIGALLATDIGNTTHPWLPTWYGKSGTAPVSKWIPHSMTIERRWMSGHMSLRQKNGKYFKDVDRWKRKIRQSGNSWSAWEDRFESSKPARIELIVNWSASHDSEHKCTLIRTYRVTPLLYLPFIPRV
jgi:hypothetical protein